MGFHCQDIVIHGLVCVCMGFILLPAQSVPALDGDVPPMVEKHIFSPDTVKKNPLENKTSPVVKQIEQQIIFTGVIISAQGRRAMLREKAVRRGTTHSELYKEGDEINGMTIKKIGSNFIILAGKGKSVKLNLYQGTKVRPAPPAVVKVGEAPESAAGRQSESPSGMKKERPEKRPAVQASAPETAGRPSRSGSIPPNPSRSLNRNILDRSNPFLEAVRRAAGKRE
jgi:hypothetical protein